MLLAFSVLFVGSTRARNVKAEPSLSQEYLDNPVSKGKNYDQVLQTGICSPHYPT